LLCASLTFDTSGMWEPSCESWLVTLWYQLPMILYAPPWADLRRLSLASISASSSTCEVSFVHTYQFRLDLPGSLRIEGEIHRSTPSAFSVQCRSNLVSSLFGRHQRIEMPVTYLALSDKVKFCLPWRLPLITRTRVWCSQ
jgi:hypothetical protein